MRATPLLTCILLACKLLAQPHALEFAPVFRNYTTDQGLPNNWVYDIYQDSIGYIWVSTDNGVCRFNGYNFEQFRDTLYTNETSVLTGALAEDAKGRIWYVDYEARVFYIENGVIHPYTYNHLIAAQKGRTEYYNTIFVSGDGDEIWLSGYSQSGVLHIWGNRQFEHILTPYTLYFAVTQFGEKPRYSYIKTKNFNGNLRDFEIAVQSDSLIINVTQQTPPYQISSKCFIKQLNDGSYCVYEFGYLSHFKLGKLDWIRQSEATPLKIYEMRDGGLLVGYHRGGLKQYHSLEALRLDQPKAHFFANLTVSKIIRDREGGYWIGTQDQGLFYCPNWTSGNTASNTALAGQNIKALASDGERHIFAGMDNGIIFDMDPVGNQFTEMPRIYLGVLNGLSYNAYSQSLAVAGEPSYLYKKGQWQELKLFSRDNLTGRITLSSLHFTPVSQSPDWVSSSASKLAIVSFEGKRLYQVFEGDFCRFYAALQAPDGRIWASRFDGLFEWKGRDTFLTPGINHPAFKQVSRAIAILSDGSLVLSPKGHGVVIWKPGDTLVTEINQHNGLLSNKVGKIYVDKQDVIWACSNNGLNRISPVGYRRYRVDNFTVKQGLPSNTVNDVVVLGQDVWIATAKGLYRLRHEPDPAPIPAPVFPSILVNTVAYPADLLHTLPYDSANLIIDFLALHFRSNGAIPYRFRLLKTSGDTTWNYTMDRQVYFSNLPHDRYRFEVQAQGDDGRWSPVSVLPFEIRPPWWASWWARTIGGLLLALAIYLLFRYRTSQFLKESKIQAELKRLENAALQAQMNPHFIFNCLNSIQHFILKNDSDAAVLYLAKFAKLVRDTLNASVAGELSLEEEIRMLDNYLSLEQLRFKQLFDYQIIVDPELRNLNPLLPPLIVQPFVENAILHGMKEKGADGHIRIKFYTENLLLLAEVSDNGPGLHSNARPDGKKSLGRNITSRRLELINQQDALNPISVSYKTPEIGSGTVVLISLPLRPG